MNKTCCVKVSLIIASILVAGCASVPTTGDKMLAKGVTAQELANKWNEGNKLFIEGEKLKIEGQKQVKEGQKIVKEGEDKIEEADVMISEGRRMMEKSEKAYADKFPNDNSLK
jgi:hypothetical protein